MAIFHANLRGSAEVPPVRTNASGFAQFRLSSDGTQLRFSISVANIERMTKAHIHLGRRGTNGPVVAPLIGDFCRGVSLRNGVMNGSISRRDLQGPLAGQPLSVLLQQMNAGNTYVNVHTESHPDGEIRGQIRRVG